MPEYGGAARIPAPGIKGRPAWVLCRALRRAAALKLATWARNWTRRVDGVSNTVHPLGGYKPCDRDSADQIRPTAASGASTSASSNLASRGSGEASPPCPRCGCNGAAHAPPGHRPERLSWRVFGFVQGPRHKRLISARAPELFAWPTPAILAAAKHCGDLESTIVLAARRLRLQQGAVKAVSRSLSHCARGEDSERKSGGRSTAGEADHGRDSLRRGID